MSRSTASYCILCLTALVSAHSSWSKTDFRPKSLSRNEFVILADNSQQSQDQFNYTLSNILIPRVSGTPDNFKVFNFLKNYFLNLGWSIEEDAFSANTPFDNRPFRNLIVTLNPNACKRLVLACHYDSKWFEKGEFVGATDSAVPCAMLLSIALDMDSALKSHQIASPTTTTLQFIFFDGEEAFAEWSDTDSLYGSRHLADKWNRTPVSPAGVCGSKKGTVSEIDRIELFVLLDLLGAKNPSFYSFFPDTDVYYAALMNAEKELNNAGLLYRSSAKETNYFKNRRSFGLIEDDHIPFMRKGVPILHLITSPFPSVWHKLSDNESALHHPTIRNLIAIFKSFVAQFLHLNLNL